MERYQYNQMTTPPSGPTGPQEQLLQINLPDLLPIVDKFLDAVNPDQTIEAYRKALLARRSPGFKPSVKYLDTISMLHALDPQTADAFYCLEIARLSEPKAYGKTQRERLIVQAAHFASSDNSPIAAALASNPETLNEVFKIIYLSPATAEKIAKLRPAEEQQAIIQKIAENFFYAYSIYLSGAPTRPEEAALFLKRVFRYFNTFSDSAILMQVIDSIRQRRPGVANRLIRLIAYFANLDNRLIVTHVNSSSEQYEMGTIFNDDMAFLQDYIESLTKEERTELAKLATSLSTKSPELVTLTEETKVDIINKITQAEIERALQSVRHYTKVINEGNKTLDAAEVVDVDFRISFHDYHSPADTEAIKLPPADKLFSLNHLAYHPIWQLNVYNVPSELTAEFELLLARREAVKARLQQELGKQFEKAIPAIVNKAVQEVTPLPKDNYQAVVDKLTVLDGFQDHMDEHYWNERIFPEQCAKLMVELKKALEKQKKVLTDTLPEKQKLLKQQMLREAEINYREALVRARIDFLLTKYSIVTSMPLEDIEVSVYTSEKDDLVFDHVIDESVYGQRSTLNYELSQDPEFMKLKEKAIDLIIPHEIGHLVIDEFKQADQFKRKNSQEFKPLGDNLDKGQKKLLEHHLKECIIDGVGYGLSLEHGGTNTHPGEHKEILIELSQAFANLEKALELQEDQTIFSKLIVRLRLTANIELLLDEATKYQVADELVSGFHQCKTTYAETIEKANQKIPSPLPVEQLNAIRVLMRKAVEHGRQIKHYKVGKAD